MEKNVYKLNIEPLKIKNLNCYDNNIIADISRFFQRNYRISLLGEFDFTYRNIEKTENLLGYKDIFTGDILHTPQMLSKFVGIHIERQEITIKEPISKFIKQILGYVKSNVPVGIGMDCYYLPWNPKFEQLHRMHYFLIVGFDLDENVFYCLDSSLSNQINKLPIFLVYNQYNRLVLIKDIKDEKPYSINDIVSELCVCLSNSGKSMNCNAIREFSKDILNKRFLNDKKVPGDLLEKANLLFRFTDLANSRYNFSCALRFIADTKNISCLDKSIEEVLCVYKNWELAKSFIVRGYLSGQVTKNLYKVSDLLNQIAVKEEKILRELQMICI